MCVCVCILVKYLDKTVLSTVLYTVQPIMGV